MTIHYSAVLIADNIRQERGRKWQRVFNQLLLAYASVGHPQAGSALEDSRWESRKSDSTHLEQPHWRSAHSRSDSPMLGRNSSTGGDRDSSVGMRVTPRPRFTSRPVVCFGLSGSGTSAMSLIFPAGLMLRPMGRRESSIWR